VIVLDAQALEAFLIAEPAKAEVGAMLKSGEQSVMTAINLGEAADRMVRVRGAELIEFAAAVSELGIHITSVDSELALTAAGLRATHYHRSRRPVSLADCVAAACSLDRVARLATSDPHLLALVLDEGGLVEPLPASDGTRWSPQGT
jgi:PIN domain nuclease of toxin-antitoxin system